MPDDERMIAALVRRLLTAFEPGEGAGQQRHALGVQADTLQRKVRPVQGEMAGQSELVRAQHMDGEMRGIAKDREPARGPRGPAAGRLAGVAVV